MSTLYIIPQALVYQEFNLVPSAITDPLRACIVGPLAQLVRHSVTSEKANGSLGAYDAATDTCKVWPNRMAGAVVDPTYTRLFIDDALLLYFTDLSASGSEIKATYCDPDIGGYRNRIRATSLNWKTYGAYARDARLLERDVQLGDSVRMVGVAGGSAVEFWSYIAGFVHDVIAGTVAAPVTDTNNAVSASSAATSTQIAGDYNDVDVSLADPSGYNGLVLGNVRETYTVEVISGSAGGDATTAVLRVTSASGNDDDASLVPSAFGAATPIGARGLQVTWDDNTGSSSMSGTPDGDFIAGQKWEITVSQVFAQPSVSASGSYTGPKNANYIVEVLTGGTWAELPQVMVTTDVGIDASGPHTVADGVAVAIGSYGATLAFAGTGLSKGDKYYVGVAAQSNGPVRTIVLGHNLPDSLLGLYNDSEASMSSVDPGTCGAGAPDLSVYLYIKKSIEVDQNRTGFAPLVNWTQSATEICVMSGIPAYDASWVDGTGELLPLPVKYGSAYVTYRAWRQDKLLAVGSVSDTSEVAAELAPIDKDNPLGMGVFKAVSNSNGTPVKYIATTDTLFAGYAAALAVLKGREDVYNVIPMTFDRQIQDLVAGHVTSLSSPENGRWRATLVSSQAVEQLAVLEADANGEALLAYVSDDPQTSNTQYTFVELFTPNGQLAVELLQSGVRAGDILRCLYTGDGFGNASYAEYQIDAVLSEDSLRLVSGPTAPVTVPQKIEIWRTLVKSDVASELAQRAGSFADRRVCNVWPDQIGSGGETLPGYYLTAALAGLTSGVVPQQGLTNLEINGFDNVPRTTQFFDNDQLNTLAAAGVWIVTQDPSTGKVYTRHALTTDMTDVNTREQMVTKNVDSISYVYLRQMAPFIGISNVTPTAIAQIEVELVSVGDYLKTNGTIDRLGSQLIDAKILQLAKHPTMRDRVVARIGIELPYPLNNCEVHIIV